MGRNAFKIILTAVVLLTLCTGTYAWQGRMGGMANPYGLMADESDFLIHPALIAKGNGMKVYSHFFYQYTDIYKWDFDLDIAGNWYLHDDSSGDQDNYGALIGTAFDLGKGRMGIFFAYEGLDRDIDGDSQYRPSSSSDPSTSADYDLESDMDDFSVRLIYGFPIDFNCLNIGAEAKISYIDEKNSNEWENNFGTSFLNHPMATAFFWMEANTLYFQTPYESDYWDARFKASADGRICLDNINPIDITLTVGGGFIFSGDNEYQYDAKGTGFQRACVDADGDVDGYNMGGELWARYHVDDDISVPFIVRADLTQKTRDGSGSFHDPDNFFGVGVDGYSVDYDQREESFELETGLGLDMKLANDSRMATGLFYTYIQSTNDITFDLRSPGNTYLASYDDKSPDYKEHRITLKMGWENSLSDTATIRAGLNTFYGFVDKEYVFDFSDTIGQSQKDDLDFDGYQWQIAASFGATFKFDKLSLEPYVNAGYRDLDLDGDEETTGNIMSVTADLDESREEWFVGGGLSILFGN